MGSSSSIVNGTRRLRIIEITEAATVGQMLCASSDEKSDQRKVALANVYHSNRAPFADWTAAPHCLHLMGNPSAQAALARPDIALRSHDGHMKPGIAIAIYRQ